MSGPPKFLGNKVHRMRGSPSAMNRIYPDIDALRASARYSTGVTARIATAPGEYGSSYYQIQRNPCLLLDSQRGRCQPAFANSSSVCLQSVRSASSVICSGPTHEWH